MSAANETTYREDHPLQEGITLLEASAGTGKTYSLTFLYLRLLVERGLAPHEIVVVTFTKAAAAELRERIHARIAAAEKIAAAMQDGTYTPGDPETEKIHDVLTRSILDDSLQALQRAQSQLDMSVISTIHSFARRLGDEFSTITGTPSHAELVDSLDVQLDAALLDLEHRLAEAYPRVAYRIAADDALHDAIRATAKVLLSDPDVRIAPDALYYLPQARQLEQAIKCLNGPDDTSLLEDIFVARLKKLATYIRNEGGDAYWEWLKAIRKTKRINGNSIRQKSIEKSIRTLLDVDEAIATDDNALFTSAYAIKRLGINQPLEKCALKFLSYTFLANRHKADSLPISEKPDAEHAPSFTREVDDLIALGNVLTNDTLSQVWAKQLGQALAAMVRARAADAGVRSFSDLIGDIATAMKGPERADLIHAVQQRYKAALIDEFQDTDLRQWTIFKDMFPPERAITYLIGDPKQAIYGFRGANVAVYNMVRDTYAHRVMYLDTNYRSDAVYNQTVNRIFAHASGIAYREVHSPDRDIARRVRLAPTPWPESLENERVTITGNSADSAVTARIMCGQKAEEHREHCARNIARDIGACIAAESTNQLFENNEWRAITPADCAVIVRDRKWASAVMVALQEARIPAVMRDKTSAALSEAANGLLGWLAAIDAPTDTRAVRAFLSSPLVHLPIDALDALTEEHIAEWAHFFAELKDNWSARGLHSALRATLHHPIHTTEGDTAQRPDAHDATEASQQPLDFATKPPPTLDLLSRLLRRSDGMRIAGDIMHLAEVLNTVQRQERHSPASLQRWFLRKRHEEARHPGTNPAFQRRIASDDDAVEIVTAHGSKGLEYPLVWACGLTSGQPNPNFLTHPDEPTVRYAISKRIFKQLQKYVQTLDGNEDPQRSHKDSYHTLLQTQFPSLQDSEIENALSVPEKCDFSIPAAVRTSLEYAHAEDLRLLYVALTRARLRTTIYVHAKKGTGADEEPLFAVPITDAAQETTPWDPAPEGVGGLLRSDAWPEGTLCIEQWQCPQQRPMALSLPAYQPRHKASLPHIEYRTPPRVRATRQQRPSFSSLMRNLPAHFGTSDTAETERLRAQEVVNNDRTHDDSIAKSAHATALKSGENDASEGEDGLEIYPAAPEELLTLSWYASGREAGTALHRVFERMDFKGAAEEPISEAWRLTLDETTRSALIAGGLPTAVQKDILQEGVIQTLRTPLGGELGALRLADIPMADKIAELQFYIPVGNDASHSTLKAIIDALTTRKGDPRIAPEWFDDLTHATHLYAHIRGLLLGFIDLTFRVSKDGTPRYYIVDYKSNRMAPQNAPLVSSMFDAGAMRAEMRHHHYYLQYHLYLLALHRWLRTRIDDYDYDRHVGGAYYLFVRGMNGASTPMDGSFGHGVFFDRPPKSTIDALDAALGQEGNIPETTGGNTEARP